MFPLNETEPAEAYNMWAKQYDAQPGNLMLDLDEALFSTLIGKVLFTDKIIVDVGCGTGRHWKKVYEKQPKKLIGYDVSEGMLKILKQKFPLAETYQLTNSKLTEQKDASVDIIISTLAIAHIENIEEAFTEWSRVLKTNGHIIITDYHPEALSKGGDRTFVHNGKRIAIKNYVHPIEKLRALADKLHFKIEEINENRIDETVKRYYEQQSALHTFERFKGTAIIYGAHLIKTDAAI